MSGIQNAVLAWMLECFGKDSTFDKQERSIRFLEESLELAQACGVTIDQAHAMVDFVFARNVGEIDQEVGGVMVTLAALCAAMSIDLSSTANAEMARIATRIAEIRAKQLTKPQV